MVWEASGYHPNRRLVLSHLRRVGELECRLNYHQVELVEVENYCDDDDHHRRLVPLWLRL
ncbi:hypothetical protein DMN57_26015 [Escherichia coli]|nr:hypothetical protein [Escherichia coli]